MLNEVRFGWMDVEGGQLSLNRGVDFAGRVGLLGVTRDARDGWPVEHGRYRQVAAKACPWATRSINVRHLLGLEDVI